MLAGSPPECKDVEEPRGQVADLRPQHERGACLRSSVKEERGYSVRTIQLDRRSMKLPLRRLPKLEPIGDE